MSVFRDEKVFPFEVIHLSTGHEGGAGLAARRLNDSLIKAGIDSKFVALENATYELGIGEFAISRNFLQKFLGGVNARIQKHLSSKIFFSVSSCNIVSTKKLRRIANTTNPILHIHNWFNLLNIEQIEKLIKMGYPIVLTMHDQRIFTGGCHYSFECTNFTNSCAACPLIVPYLNHLPSHTLTRALELLNGNKSDLKFIAPSHWIFESAKSSKFLKNKDVYFIPNTLGDFSTRVEDKPNTNAIPGQVVIGVASMGVDSYVKGTDVVADLREAVTHQGLAIEITYLNDPKIQTNPSSLFWNAIDFLLVPSRADNSPNVIHEAKSLGIPVIATRVGGITELLNPAFDVGLEVNQLRADVILEKLNHWIRENKVSELYEMQGQFESYIRDSVSKHIELYSKMASSEIDLIGY